MSSSANSATPAPREERDHDFVDLLAELSVVRVVAEAAVLDRGAAVWLAANAYGLAHLLRRVEARLRPA